MIIWLQSIGQLVLVLWPTLNNHGLRHNYTLDLLTRHPPSIMEAATSLWMPSSPLVSVLVVVRCYHRGRTWTFDTILTLIIKSVDVSCSLLSTQNSCAVSVSQFVRKGCSNYWLLLTLLVINQYPSYYYKIVVLQLNRLLMHILITTNWGYS